MTDLIEENAAEGDVLEPSWVLEFSAKFNPRMFVALIGGFHVVVKIIRELKSHMIPYKFKCSHRLKLQHSD